ncbi:MAG: pteridine reductase [Xanthomonadales bacterium]|nr:pteridine reductase [Xanthomonadales bacterium]
METQQHSPVALITGGARRVGAAVVRTLHSRGYRIVLHHRASSADDLAAELELQRPDSVVLVSRDFAEENAANALAAKAVEAWGRLDVLVNNASTFYPTPVGEITAEHWDDLMLTNARMPLFLTQACAPALKQNHGCVVNIIDVHAQRPTRNHAVYSMAKAALHTLTLALARDLAPEVRVNGVAPGAILWADHEVSSAENQAKIDKTALGRMGEPEDIAGAVAYLLEAPYVTGHVLAVDGGRSLNI